MIEFKNISKSFGKLRVLDEVNLSCIKGECIALIGPNGCGKTTLMKTLLGMVIPDNGEIIFKGHSIKNNFEYRKHIGYMPQIGRYPDNMTIGQIVKMITNIRKPELAVDNFLYQEYQLESISDKRMRTLSGGTTQKVSATLAFLFNPEVLILDEPTAGLDPLSSEILKEKIIKEKEAGKLTIITSHLLNELDDLVTQLIYMQDGKVQFHKTIDEIKTQTGETRISKAIAGIMKSAKL